MSSNDADVIVVGGGAIGLASAWEVARRGHSVLVLERFGTGHDRASSAGLERQWRIQYSEERWSRLALETVPLWHALESAAGLRLVHRTGSLWFGRAGVATSEGELRAAGAVLERLGVPYEWLSAPEIEARFGFARLPADHEGFYQRDGGVIDVKGTVGALSRLCSLAGVRVRENERVRAVEPDGEGVTVRTDRGVHRAGAVVVNAGAFTDELLAPLGCALDLRVFRMSSAYFARRSDGMDLPTWYAFLEPEDGAANGSLYGFGHNPWTGSGLVRAASDAERPVGDADPSVPGLPHGGDLATTAAWVREHLPGLVPRGVRASTCLAALPADPGRQFHLGALPATVPHGERVVVQSAGWAFKFVPMFGRICADLALDGHSAHHDPASALA
ncbi:FAD-dependent oxidoreductase [Streptomyces liangshanensis]|uniref:FAD-dependent oxidoreductase n=1 Tax=Streptomyces liangshanensis TaxID=2717324 RepID=A0A6G9GRP8_9ACTN|nr:FAD-dependent oxidoreductase [Streptomyces liangshanensis]QIQ00928.1 FAD-dependent oxidoreductase [Streptomyces liangshanensis]